MSGEKPLTIAASSDWHIRHDADQPRFLRVGQAVELMQEMAKSGDVIVYCGDFTDFEPDTGIAGLRRSAETAAKIFGTTTKRKFGVLGNHDHEQNQADMVRKILEEEGGVEMLQGTSYELTYNGKKAAFAGVKGLGGGFGRYMLPRFGEQPIINYRDAIDAENCALREAITNTQADHIFVATHYSPIPATVMSEGPELFHGLGNSGLEDAINDFSDRVFMVVHGHAHTGDPHGRTTNGVNVDNIAIQVLQKTRQGESKEFIPTNLFSLYHLT
jgi:uncharacterized protein